MRHFFGLSLQCPGLEGHHITLAFLGETDQELSDIPEPDLQLGPTGIFMGWDVRWETGGEAIATYREELVTWLEGLGFSRDPRPWRPHAKVKDQSIAPLALLVDAVHLYANHVPIWTYPFTPAWEEREHTADIAFVIRGQDIAQIHTHAELALATHCPALLVYREPMRATEHDDLIIALNDLIGRVDAAEGAPYKAVSFSGEVTGDELLEWRMIVDV